MMEVKLHYNLSAMASCALSSHYSAHFVLLDEKTRVTNFQRIFFLVKLKTLILNKWKLPVRWMKWCTQYA